LAFSYFASLTLLFFFIFFGIFVFIILLNKKIKQVNASNAKKEDKLQNEILIEDNKNIVNNNSIKKNINYSLSNNVENNQEIKDEKIDEEAINEVFQSGFNARDGILYTEILNKKYF
jgi:predicted Holliday junction resolvase-like endonuclease